MKKGSFVFTALLVLLSVGFAAASGLLSAAAARPVVTETVLFGDASAAQGLRLEMPVHLAKALHWKISAEPQGPARVTGSVDLFKGGHTKPAESPARANTQLDVHLSQRQLAMDEHQLEAQDAPAAAPIYQKLLAYTPQKGERSERIKLADYWENYPMQADLYFVRGSRIEDYPDWDAAATFLHGLEDYFCFPIHPDETAVAAVQRGEGDRLESLSLVCDEPLHNFRNYQAVTPNSVWLLPEMRDNENRIWDYSLVPGGRSLYRLKLTGEQVPRMEDLEPVLALGDEEEISQLEVSLDETQVFLLTRSENRQILRVFNGESAELVTALELEGNGLCRLYPCDGFAVLEEPAEAGGALTLIRPVNGSWQPVWRAERPGLEPLEGPAFMPNFALSKDGTRLAAASRTAPQLKKGFGGLGRGCAFTLEVLDETGVLYAARYDVSLDKALPGEEGSGLEDYCSAYYAPGSRENSLPGLNW